MRRPVRVRPSPLIANDPPLVNDRRRLLRLRRFSVRRLPRLTWLLLRLRPTVARGTAVGPRVGDCPRRLPTNDPRYLLRLGVLLPVHRSGRSVSLATLNHGFRVRLGTRIGAGLRARRPAGRRIQPTTCV
jgi:hypothetical protein